MSRTFCNDADLSNVSGFTNNDSGVNTADLIDQVANIDYHVCNKMGTSIPTIFARMFLFSSAYNDIHKLEEKYVARNDPNYKGVAHNEVINEETGERYANVYHYLISEHLDMLEFLFTFGDEIEIEKWVFSTEAGSLQPNDIYKKQEDKGLNNLVNAIRSAIKDTPILVGGMDLEILLFKYEKVYVGGTSPDFIVFTSPNWKEIINEKGWADKLSGLFTDRACPLHERSLPFRKLLSMLALSNRLSCLESFKNYIIANKDHYDGEIKRWWEKIRSEHGTQTTASWIDEEIAKIAVPMTWTDENADRAVYSPIKDIPLYHQSANHAFITQYKISPTRKYKEWAIETINGNSVTLAGEPMLIVENGISNARYYELEYWSNVYSIPAYADLKNQYLSQRDVPGKKGTHYPIITVDDLLEENIVELAYNVDKEHFFTGCVENFNFMIPLKRMYFRFFTFENLKNNLKIELERNRDGEIVTVSVSLIISMLDTNVRNYTVNRKYCYEKSKFGIVSCRKASDAFNLGIFPFYKSDNKFLNKYRLILGETSTTVKCRIGSFGNIGFGDGEEGYLHLLEFTKRSTRDGLTTSFAEYNYNVGFEYIEIEASNANHVTSGMFFPLIPTIDAENAKDEKWAYSVDFGTSNTHIVMADTSCSFKDCKPFQYEGVGQQMVTLGMSERNKFPTFENDIIREFVPRVYGNDDDLKFPIRSVIYEKNGSGKNNELFSSRNVGFNYKKEVAKDFMSNDYVSDLKWNLHDQAMFSCRVKAYCMQLLWMLRNHSLANGGSEKIKLAVTYPLAMSSIQLRVIKDAWSGAWRALINENEEFNETNFKIESVAPYKYSVVMNDRLRRTDAYVNVDIGGGSTDILYYKENFGKKTKSLAFSVFFAANDIWGNGINPCHRLEKSNGFITTLQKELEPVEKDSIESYKKIANNSADVVTYLFSEQCRKLMNWQGDHGFSDYIRPNNISGVLVVHFAALMYYLGNIIKIEKLETPKCINFTGMGCKYIDIISPTNTDIENIVKVIFEYVGLKDTEIVTVKMERNPKEVTAMGALYMLDPLTTKVEKPNDKNSYCIDGEENLEEAITYADSENETCLKNTITKLKDFLILLQDDRFKNVVESTGINYSFKKLSDNGLTEDDFKCSYIFMTETFKDRSNEDKKQKIKDAPFFWSLKDTLYNIAENIAKNNP